MSLMLNALKQIEAKQLRPRARHSVEPREPTLVAPLATVPKPIELPPILTADDPAHLPSVGLLSCPESLETSIVQLQALVSAAGLPDNPGPAFDAEELRGAAEPAQVMPPASDPYSMTSRRILDQIAESRARVVLFTSPIDGQGKTMTVARLAPTLAKGRNGNVLVVDANFRNPDMARWFGVAPAWRLPEVVSGAVDWAAAVQVTSQTRVSLLPGGRESRRLGLGWTFQTFRRLFEDLAGHYDLVAVDAASLVHPGTVQLAAACDATFLVVRLGEISPRILREAAEVLRRNGGRLLGCVAVDAD